MFRLFDDDDSGAITLNDLLRVARELGETMTQAELKEMIDRADLDGDGVISPEEFINIVSAHTRTRKHTAAIDDEGNKPLARFPVRWRQRLYCSLFLTRSLLFGFCTFALTDDQEDIRLNARTHPSSLLLACPLLLSPPPLLLSLASFCCFRFFQ